MAKSAMVIDQHIGSYFFLCELLTSLVIEETPEPHAPRCGTCARCMDACPTGAIIGPHRVDARRCISYLTIELRGPIPRELRPLIGNHLFGCDICQSVCPWNRRADHEVIPELRPRPEVQAMQARAALQLSQTEFSTTFRKSPIKRTKRRGLARNAAVVLGNLADPDDAGLLQSAIRDHDEPLVRGHAAWALGQLALGQRNSEQRDSGQRAGANPGRTLDWVSTLRAACSSDAEAYVREEAHQALQAIQLSNVALEDDLATTSDTDCATSTQLDSD